MMDIQTTLQEMKRLKVETGSLACLGCGHEHNCSIFGCAILRNAVEHMETLQQALRESKAAQIDLERLDRELEALG